MNLQQFAIGQRWLSDTETELGLGVVIDTDERAVHILFPKSDETRVYARQRAPLSRIVFAVGDMITDQEDQEWRVIGVEERDGVLRYQASTMVNGQPVEKVLNETRLGAHIQLSKPLERLLAGQIDHKERYDLRIQALMMQAQFNRSPLRGLLGARVGLIGHQLYIANEVGTRLAPRVLLADEVGLGKTIEAGLIIHQQLHTARSERVLILVPDALQYQWMIEMRRRFNLKFSIFDLTRTAAIREHQPEQNPFATEQLIIASIDLLLDHPDLHEEAIAAGFDLLVVDEAHHLEWSEEHGGNDRYEVVADFAKHTAGVLLLTATPEQLGMESHFARLRLLDPERFHDYAHFLEEEQHYQAIAKVAEQLMSDAPLPAAQAQQLELLLGHPIGDDAQQRQRAIHELLDRFGTGRVLFRNTREAISGFAGRDCLPVPLPMPSGWNTTGKLREQMWGEELQLDGAWLEHDPRVNWLLALLRTTLKHDKVLLIARSGPVVEALEAVLRLHGGIRTALFHEGMSLLERDQAAAYFAEEGYGAQILLCSEIGSEGRNFQFAHHLVLFDLPANPDTLEQRIGRLDRIGQQHRIQIHVPYIAGSAQERMFRWYHDALGIFSHISPAAQSLHNAHIVQLKDLLLNHQPDSFDALLAQVKCERAELEAELQQGRDRLLEYNSCRPHVAKKIIQTLEEYEDNSLLPEFVKRFAYATQLDFDEQRNSTVIIRAHDQTQAEGLALNEEGITAVFYRDVAQIREDAEFLTLEHPFIQSVMDFIHTQSFGSANVAVLQSNSIKAGTLLIETWFAVETIAPKMLNVKGSLPKSLIRVLVTDQGQDLSDKIAAHVLQPYIKPVDVQQARQVTKLRREVIAARYQQALQQASSQLDEIAKVAQQHYRQRWQREIDRLKYLKQYQRAVREDEIIRLERLLQEGLAALQKLHLQPEAIRVLVAVHH